MREREVEQYFIRRVREAGGLQRKFVSPGVKGVPDRILIIGGIVYFVELKAPGKKLRPDQKREHERMFRVGANVLVMDCKYDVDVFFGGKS